MSGNGRDGRYDVVEMAGKGKYGYRYQDEEMPQRRDVVTENELNNMFDAYSTLYFRSVLTGTARLVDGTSISYDTRTGEYEAGRDIPRDELNAMVLSILVASAVDKGLYSEGIELEEIVQMLQDMEKVDFSMYIPKANGDKIVVMAEM